MGNSYDRNPGTGAHRLTMEQRQKLGSVTAEAHGPPWRVDLRSAGHELISDEPQPEGGNTGPAPFSLWLSGLAACTASTLRMYAERKGWPLERVDVRLTYQAPSVKELGEVHRSIRLTGPLDDAQRARLAEIAERTPVTKVVKAGVPIETKVE
jgi:putative redox protein